MSRGWLQGIMEEVRREVQTWPAWMKGQVCEGQMSDEKFEKWFSGYSGHYPVANKFDCMSAWDAAFKELSEPQDASTCQATPKHERRFGEVVPCNCDRSAVEGPHRMRRCAICAAAREAAREAAEMAKRALIDQVITSSSDVGGWLDSPKAVLAAMGRLDPQSIVEKVLKGGR